MWLAILAIAGAWAAVCAGLGAEKVKDLHFQGYVNDFAGVLSGAAREKLRALCTEVDRKAGAQIAIVTVKSLDGEAIEDFSVQLATQWGVGPKQKSRGVMILLAPGEHKDRFEVGYGLEPILPDGRVGGFGREAVPLLRENDYDGAVLLMTQRVAAVIAEDKGVTLDALRGASASPERDDGNSGSHFQFPPRLTVLLVFFLISIVIRLIFSGTGRGTRCRGGGGWWIGPMIGGGGGSWGGGGFGGGGGGGGGFGGFGGGSFGGGGASGSW
ncbi:MAG: TPM domain-containing protein [Candidatus Acidiferrales bacterium]